MRSRTFENAFITCATLASAACVNGDVGDDDNLSTVELAASSTKAKWLPFGPYPSVEAYAQVEVVRQPDGALALFARTTSGSIRFAEQTTAGGSWTAITSLDGHSLKDMAIAENQDGRMEIFALGGDGAIYHQWQTAPGAPTFSGWASLGGTALKDVAVARNQNGALVMTALGGDGMVYEQRQVQANGGFGGWSYVGGVGVTRIAMATQKSGRLVLLGTDPYGELFITGQPTVNGLFQGWTTLGGHGLRDFEVIRNLDGRLEVIARGGDNNTYYSSQVAPDVGWNGWGATGSGTAKDLALSLAADGSLNIFTVNSIGAVTRVAQNGPSAGYVQLPAMGGNDFATIDSERNHDGRLEVFAINTGGQLFHTWQTSANGPWIALPDLPTITSFTVTPLSANTGSSITASWSVTIPPGCTHEGGVFIVPSGESSTRIAGAAVTGSASFTLHKNTAVKLVVGCAEHRNAGDPVVTREVQVTATQPPPPPPPSCPAGFAQCGINQCPAGYHTAWYAYDSSCGTGSVLYDNKTQCEPNCGISFKVCGSQCPTGYHAIAFFSSHECEWYPVDVPGNNTTTCVKN